MQRIAQKDFDALILKRFSIAAAAAIEKEVIKHITKQYERMESIFEKVVGILAEELGVLPQNVLPESDLEYDLGADSLDRLMIVMHLEEEFNVEIVDDEADKMQKVNDIVEWLTENAEE